MQEIEITKSKPLRRLAVVGLGWILLLVGTVGLFLPVVPAVLLIVVAALMAVQQRVLELWRARLPILEHAFRRFSPWGRRFPNRARGQSRAGLGPRVSSV